MTKNKFKEWHPVVPDQYRAKLQKNLTFYNISRLRILAFLTIIINLILICIQQAFMSELDFRPIYDIDTAKALHIAPQLILLRLAFIGLSLIFLVVFRKPIALDLVSVRHHYYTCTFILFNLVGYSVLSGLIQSAGPGIASSYIMAILVAAAFCYLNWTETVLIYSVSWCAMSFMVWSFQPDWLIAFSGFLNCSIMTVLALAISRIVYTSRVREFLQKEELAKTNDKLQRLSYLDGLTNIPNRRHFDLYLQKEWRKAIRHRTWLALIMIDVDCFKLYNDTYGHQAGDDSLTQIATTLNNVINRPNDMVARYGGEEFVVILPDTNLKGACNIANQMKTEVENLNICHDHSPSGRLTISLGLACMEPDSHTLPDSLLSTADRALYQSKNSGGNQFSYSSES